MTATRETVLAEVHGKSEDSAVGMDGLRLKIIELREHMDDRFDKVDERFDGLHTEVNSLSEHSDKRFDRIEDLLIAIAQHLGIPVMRDPESKAIRLQEGNVRE